MINKLGNAKGLGFSVEEYESIITYKTMNTLLTTCVDLTLPSNVPVALILLLNELTKPPAEKVHD